MGIEIWDRNMGDWEDKQNSDKKYKKIGNDEVGDDSQTPPADAEIADLPDLRKIPVISDRKSTDDEAIIREGILQKINKGGFDNPENIKDKSRNEPDIN